MALYPITPPAGIVKNGTDYANKGRWVDGDLVRFENGYLKPIGGWTNFENTTHIEISVLNANNIMYMVPAFTRMLMLSAF